MKLNILVWSRNPEIVQRRELLFVFIFELEYKDNDSDISWCKAWCFSTGFSIQQLKKWMITEVPVLLHALLLVGKKLAAMYLVHILLCLSALDTEKWPLYIEWYAAKAILGLVFRKTLEWMTPHLINVCFITLFRYIFMLEATCLDKIEGQLRNNSL